MTGLDWPSLNNVLIGCAGILVAGWVARVIKTAL